MKRTILLNDDSIKRLMKLGIMQWVLWFELIPTCLANTSIVSIAPTQMQAEITVHTDQSGNCTYRVSRGSSFSSNIADLADNGNTDARIGSIVNGTEHIFVVGTRKGADALAADAAYLVGVRCGRDSEVSTSFKTLPIPWGNMAPDPVPFNAARFGNMDYPLIDWNDQTKSYVDPISGAEYWRMTGPGMLAPTEASSIFGSGVQTPMNLSGSGWSNLLNLTTGGRSTGTLYAIASGTSANQVFLPLSPGTLSGHLPGWTPQISLDDLLVNVYCGSASVPGQTVTLQISFDSGQSVQGSPVTTRACPTTAPVKLGTYPQPVPKATLKGWGFADLPRHDQVAPSAGTVSVAGSVVTLQNPNGPANYFATNWPPGSLIQINGSYYHLASVQSPAQVTLAESPGTLTNVRYQSAAFGIVLTKNGGGSLSLSVGVDVYGSSIPNAGVNGDVGSQNPISVSVSKSGDGMTNLNPPLTGYLTFVTDFGGAASIILWIPYNSDGTVRNETRLLSLAQKQASSPGFHTNGDPLQYTVGLVLAGNAFDKVDGKSFFGSSNNRFYRATYDETLPGCAGFVTYNPYPKGGGYPIYGLNVADDCFQYYNLTPSSANPPMDMRSQITRGYQSGLNSLGRRVGPAHPGFDLGWLGSPNSIMIDGGYFTAEMSNWGEHLSVIGAFDTQTGVLRMVKNLWGGDDDTEARWGGVHNIALSAGSWRWASMNHLDNNTGQPGATVFNSAFDLPVIKVNRVGYFAAPNWDTNTRLDGTEAYTCPPASAIPPRYAKLGGTNNCVQVKVSTPPCNATPNTSYVFPDGKTEAAEFPCTTPGFGVADPKRSKLMDLRPGDWMYQRGTGVYNEQFIVFMVAYNATNDIDVTLCRWGVHNYLMPIFGGVDDFSPTHNARSNGWLLSMAQTMNFGAMAMAIDASAGSAARWLLDNPARAGCHGVVGPGTTAGRYIYAEPCTSSSYVGQFDVSPPDMLFEPFTTIMAASYPGFAGSSAGIANGFVQAYNNNSWWFGAANPPFQLDMRHINPPYGAGAEYLSASLGSARRLTLVPGTGKTYLIEDNTSADAADPKRLPYHFWAGYHLLKDVSSPKIGNTIDLPDFSGCRAYHAGECIVGSVAGNLYVTVPQAYVDSTCRTDQFTLPAPCAIQLMPYAGQMIQFRTDRADTTGLTTRKFGYLHGFPGIKYEFSNCRATPEAGFSWCVIDWADGKRSEWFSIRIAPMPKTDGVDRTKFISIPVSVPGISEAVSVRARFGYLENGGSLLHCTSYQVECSTEIPSSAPSDPYSFMNEAVTRQACGSGSTCNIMIPVIPNRMIYYVVDQLDASGNVVTSYPMRVAAVP